MLCHNDVCPENVVFRNGRATALIDFDLAAPGRAVWDVAMTARYWVPMLDPTSAAVLYPAGWMLRHDCGSSPTATVSPRRSAVNCLALSSKPPHPAGPSSLIEWPTVTPSTPRRCPEHGGWQRWDRIQQWLVAHHEMFTAALLG